MNRWYVQLNLLIFLEFKNFLKLFLFLKISDSILKMKKYNLTSKMLKFIFKIYKFC